MKTLFLLLAFIGFYQFTSAQKLISKDAHISFFSETPMENIEAHNRQAVSILNTEDGTLKFSLLVKSFEFEKNLMEEHFNENYMESDKHPKASFTGTINNLSSVNFSKEDSYTLDVRGSLTIHGVTQEVTIPATLIIAKETAKAKAVFTVVPKDYDISIPKLVEENIAKEIKITVEVKYKLNS